MSDVTQLLEQREKLARTREELSSAKSKLEGELEGKKKRAAELEAELKAKGIDTNKLDAEAERLVSEIEADNTALAEKLDVAGTKVQEIRRGLAELGA